MVNAGGSSPKIPSNLSGSKPTKTRRTLSRAAKQKKKDPTQKNGTRTRQQIAVNAPAHIEIFLRGLGRLTLRRMQGNEYRIVGGSTAAPKRRSFLRKFFSVEAPREITVEAALYLNTDDAATALRVTKAMQGVLADMGYSRVDITNVERGSIWARFVAWLNADETEDSAVQLAAEAATKLKHYADLAMVGKLQAEVDAIRAKSAAELIASLESSSHGAVLMGEILVVKYPGEGEKSVTIVTVLTTEEVMAYQKHRGILRNPETLLADLAGLVAGVGNSADQTSIEA